MNKYFKINSYINYVKNRLIKYQKYYSQTGEDLILDSLLKHKKNGLYVDIGANDPKKLSNTYLFYKRGWKGLNIEPNIKKFKKLIKYRKNDININIGVGNKKEILPFYNFYPDTLSTFSEKAAESYKSMGHKLVSKSNVEILPLKDILAKYLPDQKIDFLSVDTEGFDLEVLKSNDWTMFRPKFLIVETVEYSTDDVIIRTNQILDDYLFRIGYKPIFDTSINTIYKDYQ